MKISQREARRLQKRVSDLMQTEASRARHWSQEYPGGTNIETLEDTPIALLVAIKTARMLNHAVVVTQKGKTLFFYALPLASQEIQ